MKRTAAAVSRLANEASTHPRDLTNLWHNHGDKESVPLISQAETAIITLYEENLQHAK